MKTGLLFALITIFSVGALANSVKEVKGKKARLELSTPDDFAIGDRVFGLDENGKRKGLLSIEKMKGKAAIAVITKGNVTAGMTLMKAPGGTASKSKSDSKSSGTPGKFSLGAIAGYGYDSMTVKVTTAGGTFIEQLNMSGTGFSFKAMADYDFTSYLGIRLFMGLEQFNASATPKNILSCEGSKCNTAISYITLDAWARYAIIEGSTKVWLGAGAGSLSPTTKTSNALDPQSISSTFAFYLGGGADFNINKEWYVPTQVDYAILPTSDQVQASIIAVRVGISKRF